MQIGYARVSAQDQNLDRQTDQLKLAGCDRIYQEKFTGTKKDRPELDRLLDQLRPGDLIIITELTRLSRSIKDLFALADLIHQKGAHLKSLSEPWLDTTTPAGKLSFAIFAGISQFERDLISERTKDGLAAARARGRKGGRLPKSQSSQKSLDLALKMHAAQNCTIPEITAATGIPKTTLYRYLKSKTT